MLRFLSERKNYSGVHGTWLAPERHLDAIKYALSFRIFMAWTTDYDRPGSSQNCPMGSLHPSSKSSLSAPLIAPLSRP
jgi:hypothetical protein